MTNQKNDFEIKSKSHWKWKSLSAHTSEICTIYVSRTVKWCTYSAQTISRNHYMCW